MQAYKDTSYRACKCRTANTLRESRLELRGCMCTEGCAILLLSCTRVCGSLDELRGRQQLGAAAAGTMAHSVTGRDAAVVSACYKRHRRQRRLWRRSCSAEASPAQENPREQTNTQPCTMHSTGRRKKSNRHGKAARQASKQASTPTSKQAVTHDVTAHLELWCCDT